MTNAQIILTESLRLMQEGKLHGTGEIIRYEIGGQVYEAEMPEQIHTFNGWKERGYKVKEGAHSEIKFPIWKYTSKEKKPDELTGNPINDAPDTSMFMKMSAFFTASQVERA